MQSFYIGDDCNEGVDSRDEDQYHVIDVRKNLHLELLDDFHISGTHIVISEVSERRPVFASMGPSGVNDTSLNSLLTPWPDDVVNDQFDRIPEIHHLAQQMIDCAEPFDWDSVDEINLFCDGSTYVCNETENVFAGCAVIITATTKTANGTGYSLLGFTGGSICTDPESTHWWGAESAQSIEAERTAVLLSMLWFLQSPFAVGHPCTIWFDCMAAGYGAAGIWNYPVESTLAELVRGVGQLCEECNPGHFRFAHTHAHVGDPGNELADSAAKAFAQGKIPNLLSNIDIHWLVQATLQHGSWIWFQFGTFVGMEDLPPYADQCMRLPERTLLAAAPEKSSFLKKDCSTQAWNVTLNIGTVNVKSLDSCEESSGASDYMPTKASFLAQQLEWGGYGLVGLQECCTKSPGISRIGIFTRVCGDRSNRGQLGCEIWICNKTFHHQAHDICVLHCDERRLLIRVQNSHIDITVGSLHSPHSGVTTEERSHWWRQTSSICQRIGKLAPLILCIDANAQITETVELVTGTLLDGNENDNEQFLITLCKVCELFIPSTFHDLHYNENGTWWHPSGQWLRIDYILLPQAWKTSASYSWTDTDFDMGSTSDDHRPAGCKIWISMQKMDQSSVRSQYDWNKLQNQRVCEELGELIGAIPKIPWDTNVHDHAILIHDALHDSMWKALGPARSTKKASYITDATWATRAGKLKLKKELSGRDRFACTAWLVWSFSAWRESAKLIDVIRPHLHWLLKFERKSAYIRRALIDTAKDLRRSLHQDRALFAKNCAQRCERQPLQTVFQELKPLRIGGVFRKRKQPPLPLLRQLDGKAATSPSELAEIWRQHCAGLEAGEIVTADQLVYNAQNATSHRHCTLVAFDELPSLSVLERHVRKVRAGKAPGCDSIPSALCNTYSRQISRLLYPLLLKQAVSLEEALEFKGGLLVAAYKNKGRTDDVRSYRGLMLTSILGKTIRSAYRERMLNVYYEFTADGHFSARNRGNVGQAALTLRLFLRYSKNLQKSCGIIFLDIQHAYYSVCRELASGFTGTDEELCRLFSFFRLSPDTVDELKKLIHTGSAMDFAGCSDFHKALLHELGTATWYKVKHSDTITQTHGGSRPGDGLADLIFGYIFARMLDSMRSAMIEAGIWDPQPWNLQADRSCVLCDGYIPHTVPTNLEICWADDLAMAMLADTAQGLVERIQATGGFLLRWVKQFGMSPNLQRGKSETLLHLRGPGSRKLKLELFAPEDPTLDVVLNDDEAVQLRITHQYRHLGGQLHYIGNMVQEVKARCGMARSAFADYRRKIFSNKDLSLKHRGQLLQSLIFSVLRWNYGAWPALDSDAYNRYSSTTLILAKKICYADNRKEEVWSRSARRVMADLSMSSPQEALHVARLSFYTTAIHTAPDCVWVMIAAERSWINQVDEAVQWMWQQLHNSTSCTNFVDFMSEWAQQVVRKTRSWRGWVKRAEQHAILQRCNQELIEQWHSDYYDKLVMMGFSVPTITLNMLQSDHSELHLCGPCKQVFHSRTAWAVHSFKKHGRREPLRSFITNGTCRACGGEYHTTRRLLAHLKYRRRCAIGHVWLQPPTDLIPPGRNSGKEDKDRNLPLPCIRGDQHMDITKEMENFYREQTCNDTLTPALQVLLQSLDGDADADAVSDAEEIRQLLLRQLMAADDLHRILTLNLERCSSQADHRQADAILQVLNNWTADWFFGNQLDDVTYPQKDYETVSMVTLKSAAMQEASYERLGGPNANHIPRVFYRELFAIHFFSGTRREGDFQQWIGTLTVPGGFLLTPISVDILFNDRLGDLTNRETQKKWMALALTGAIIAALMGPPCNTWSVSRWRYLLGLDRGPRPVRFHDSVFGASSLRLREIRQVLLGNSLLFFAFDMVLALGLLRRVAILEHPDIPTADDKIPTIWRTGAFSAIRRLPGVQVLQIHQGVLGAVSPKPTRLCVTGGVNCQTHIDRHSVFCMPPPLHMQREGAQFSTAKLKEYPSHLCAAFADAVQEWLDLHCCNFDSDSASTFTQATLELVDPFRVDYTGLFAYGADTRGRAEPN